MLATARIPQPTRATASDSLPINPPLALSVRRASLSRDRRAHRARDDLRVASLRNSNPHQMHALAIAVRLQWPF